MPRYSGRIQRGSTVYPSKTLTKNLWSFEVDAYTILLVEPVGLFQVYSRHSVLCEFLHFSACLVVLSFYLLLLLLSQCTEPYSATGRNNVLCIFALSFLGIRLSYITLVSSFYFSYTVFMLALAASSDPLFSFSAATLRYLTLCTSSESTFLQSMKLAITFFLLLTITLFLVVLTFKLGSFLFFYPVRKLSYSFYSLLAITTR